MWTQHAALGTSVAYRALLTKLGHNSIFSFMLFVLNIFLYVNMIEKVIFLTQTSGDPPHNRIRIRLPAAQDLSLDI